MEALTNLQHTEAILVLSKTSFPSAWDIGVYAPLVQGPSRFLRVYFNCASVSPGLQHLREQSANWLREFKELRRLSLEGAAWPEPARRLRENILERLNWEEAVLFPAVATFLGSDRPTREMLYEHQGIRKFLPRLEESLAGDPRSRAWESFSLDLIHLLEHHIEHEESGLYPVFERLS